jgi:hypothetical protein
MNKIPLSSKWHRALEILDAAGESGSAEVVLRAHGFSTEMLRSLACVGFTTTIDGKSTPRMRITEGGRQALRTDERTRNDARVASVNALASC